MTKPKGTKENQQGLTKRQREAIPFLATSPTFEQGRKKAGVGKTTLYSWLKIPEFRKEVDRERNKVVEDALNILKLNLTKAVTTLVGLLDEEGNPELKRRVSNDIINYVMRAKELQEIEERLETVERLVFERKTYKWK